MLQKETNYEFRMRMLQVHEKGVRDLSLHPEQDEIEISDGCSVFVPKDADDVILTSARDFIDYLFVSMGVSAILRYGAGNGDGNEISVSLSHNPEKDLEEAAGSRGYRVDVDEKGIHILGFDSRGIAQGFYYLEDLMTFRLAPFVSKGVAKRKPMYDVQMVHSGYGLDNYPNEHLAKIAHEGRTAILVFVKDVNITTSGFLDLNELIYRAGKYGLDVYAYSYFKSERHPDDPDAEEYYESTYGALFKNCPKLKGVTLVGESVEFPSKDPHISGRHYYDNYIDGIPTGKRSPGWYPCYDYPQWLDLIKRIIRKYNPEADIVFWSYNWGFQPEDIRVKLIESLPTDISLQATFEMNEIRELDGIKERCADYTISFAGPGRYFESEAIAAKKRGIRLYSMVNTGGLTWDLGVIPYNPYPYQWIKRYNAMEQAHNNWGLCGLMESHHFGFYPSFISKLSKWAFYENHEDCDVILEKILKSEYGVQNFEKVNKALKLWSEACTHFTPTDADQYGAFRVGASHPFCLVHQIGIPAEKYSFFGNTIHEATYYPRHNGTIGLISKRIHNEINSLEKMKDYMHEGIVILESIDNPNTKLEYLINLGKFIHSTVITGIHAKKWYYLKTKMHVESDNQALAEIFEQMETLLLAERENAEKTIPLVQVDSRLGWEPSMEYMTDEYRIRWKIRQIDYVLNSELKDCIGSYKSNL